MPKWHRHSCLCTAAPSQLGGFDLTEVGEDRERLWVRGGFPRSFLAGSDAETVTVVVNRSLVGAENWLRPCRAVESP